MLQNLVVDGIRLASRVNGNSFECGRLEIPALRELRASLESAGLNSGSLMILEFVDDVQALH